MQVLSNQWYLIVPDLLQFQPEQNSIERKVLNLMSRRRISSDIIKPFFLQTMCLIMHDVHFLNSMPKMQTFIYFFQLFVPISMSDEILRSNRFNFQHLRMQSMLFGLSAMFHKPNLLFKVCSRILPVPEFMSYRLPDRLVQCEWRMRSMHGKLYCMSKWNRSLFAMPE